MSNVAINIAAEFKGKKAFDKAGKSVFDLDKSVKKLGRNLGLTFGTAGIIAYGKKAAKAFAEDQRAATSLSKTIENLGLGFGGSALEVNNYISNLERQTGVLDDELRPAMDRLLRATSDITKSQELLSLALDISAGTGRDLTQVSQSLQKAYLGQTQALGRLGVGLSKAELSSGSFEQIQARLTELFAGQATAAADSYAGSLAKLQVAANNAAESIGKDLFTAVGTLSGGDGLPKTISLIESLSSAVGDAIIGFSRLIRNIGILASGNPIESIKDLRAATRADRAADMRERAQYGGIYAEIYKTQVASNAQQKKALTTSKAITKETAKQLADARLKNAIDKANAALAKGDDIFNMDKIQIAAALANQAEQLGKATNASQVLQIANDTARLKVKQDILALEDAIAAGDAASIEAATKKLNEDMKILGALQGQSVKLMDIKSLLESLKPKELIDQDNLNAALAKIKEMLALLAQVKTPIITPPSGGGVGGFVGTFPGSPDKYPGTIQYPNTVYPNYGMQTASSIEATNLNTALLGGVVSSIGSNLIETTLPAIVETIRQSNLKEWSSSFSPTININTGIGDPNAIAEAIDNVLTEAVSRGTLRGLTLG